MYSHICVSLYTLHANVLQKKPRPNIKTIFQPETELRPQMIFHFQQLAKLSGHCSCKAGVIFQAA